MHAEPPPDTGRLLLEREIPSDPALILPLVVRITDFLREKQVVPESFESKLQLCLEEGIRNAVIHGNQREFSRRVRVRVFESQTHWGIVVEDEGKGFSLDKLSNPYTDQSLWQDGGRGIHLMTHYMDQVDYYCGGRVLVMAKLR